MTLFTITDILDAILTSSSIDNLRYTLGAHFQDTIISTEEVVTGEVINNLIAVSANRFSNSCFSLRTAFARTATRCWNRYSARSKVIARLPEMLCNSIVARKRCLFLPQVAELLLRLCGLVVEGQNSKTG